MRRGLRIGLRLVGIHTFDPHKAGNVQGDELVARSWKKHLERRPDVDAVEVYGATGPVADDLDVVIHYTPDLERVEGIKNLCYLQNAFPPEVYPGGTVGVYQRVEHDYDGFLFTSDKLMRSCGPGAVVPFCTDIEFFTPSKDDRYAHPVAFVGSDIRGLEVNMRYFAPALDFGLVIYGGPWKPPFDACHRGKLPMPDLPALYSSSGVNLDAHIAEHIACGTINQRVYDILACEGLVITDNEECVSREFGDAVIYSDGYEDTWAKLVHYLGDLELRRQKCREGRRQVLARHTYEQRTETVVDYLRQVI